MAYTRRYRKKSASHKRRHNKHKSRKHVSKHKRRHTKTSKKSLRRKGGKRHYRRSKSNTRKMRGGSKSGCITSAPVPYKVGSGIPAGKGSLPINGRNYYELSPDLHAPNGEIMNTSLHTSVPKSFLSTQSGGSGLTKLMPQDLVNLGRSIIGGAETLYDNWQGQEPPVSSNVMVQPIAKTKNPMPTAIDMNQLEMRAEHRAATA